MKKTIFILLMTSLVFSVFSACSAMDTASPLRMHVIANSDSDEDQAVKLEVRDAILEYTAPAAAGFDSAYEVKRFVRENERGLLECVGGVLDENNIGYGADIEIGVYYFPEKSYGDVVYEAGYYDAVEVVLGEGGGQNWWCVIFPPLCLVTAGEEESGNADGVQFESLFAEMFAG